jgi:single-stranded-DNA-specific exonuclease
MKDAGDALLEYGGHAFSGGFCVSHDAVHTLEERLIRALAAMPVLEEENQTYADANVSVAEVTSETFRLLQQIAPFGQGNQKPVFIFKNVRVVGAKKFGKEKNHSELVLERSGNPLKAIKFFSEETLPETDSRVNLLASLEESRFGGRVELRLRIVDIS